MVCHDDKLTLRCVARFCLLAIGSAVLLAACSESSDLSLEDKTRFVEELIDRRIECQDYRQNLSVTAKDDKALSALYEAAKAAHCLKPDV
jgi:hypothetical protein